MEEPRWTLDELAERVDAALAVDYAGQPSGRVRDVPDRRAIRWYTTIGLVDRPLAHRGRTALYGPRHLLQLVAVKRLQASGLPLVAIQGELAGATDDQLARLARLPATGPPAPGPVVPAAAPAAPAGGADAALPLAAAPRAPRPMAFWHERPAAAGPAAPTPPGVPSATGDGVATLRGVRLGEGATLLLEPGRELGPADVAAVLGAARPLLEVLAARGLAGTEPGREHR
jgi:MerR HTH family regulatory protein